MSFLKEKLIIIRKLFSMILRNCSSLHYRLHKTKIFLSTTALKENLFWYMSYFGTKWISKHDTHFLVDRNITLKSFVIRNRNLRAAHVDETYLSTKWLIVEKNLSTKWLIEEKQLLTKWFIDETYLSTKWCRPNDLSTKWLSKNWMQPNIL